MTQHFETAEKQQSTKPELPSDASGTLVAAAQAFWKAQSEKTPGTAPKGNLADSSKNSAESILPKTTIDNELQLDKSHKNEHGSIESKGKSQQDILPKEQKPNSNDESKAPPVSEQLPKDKKPNTENGGVSAIEELSKTPLNNLKKQVEQSAPTESLKREFFNELSKESHKQSDSSGTLLKDYKNQALPGNAPKQSSNPDGSLLEKKNPQQELPKNTPSEWLDKLDKLDRLDKMKDDSTLKKTEIPNSLPPGVKERLEQMKNDSGHKRTEIPK